MIVKFFNNRGRGSATASRNYLERNSLPDLKEHQRLLKGDMTLTAEIAENLNFKNKYTVGCLYFEEENIDEKNKYEIMESFEETIFSGMDKDRYSIAWVEHTDKGRLELNFLIANVDLQTGKSYQPYYDKVDRGLINDWRTIKNHEYDLSDPDLPTKKQTVKIERNLPSSVKELKETLTSYLTEKIADGDINNRSEIITELTETFGLEVVRQTPKAISIKSLEDGGRNIRLTGGIYEENFRFDETNRESKERLDESHRADRTNSIHELRERFASRVQSKENYNQKRYGQSLKHDSRIFESEDARDKHAIRAEHQHDSEPSSENDTSKQSINHSFGSVDNVQHDFTHSDGVAIWTSEAEETGINAVISNDRLQSANHEELPTVLTSISTNEHSAGQLGESNSNTPEHQRWQSNETQSVDNEDSEEYEKSFFKSIRDSVKRIKQFINTVAERARETALFNSVLISAIRRKRETDDDIAITNKETERTDKDIDRISEQTERTDKDLSTAHKQEIMQKVILESQHQSEPKKADTDNDFSMGM